jgi:hypothetical protein
MPEGFRGPVRIGVGDEVRELGAGDSWVFNLAHLTGPSREQGHDQRTGQPDAGKGRDGDQP